MRQMCCLKSYRSVSERASSRNCLPLSAVSNAFPGSQALSLPPHGDLGPLQLPGCAQRNRTETYPPSLSPRASLLSPSLMGVRPYLGINMAAARGSENNFSLNRVAVSPLRYRPCHRDRPPAFPQHCLVQHVLSQGSTCIDLYYCETAERRQTTANGGAAAGERGTQEQGRGDSERERNFPGQFPEPQRRQARASTLQGRRRKERREFEGCK